MTLKDKFLFGLRKIAISIKRNYYVIPLILVVVCAIQIMCSLYIISTALTRVDSEKMASLLAFVVCLFTTLSCVAYLNYAMVKYGQKRPIHMLIIYYVLTAISLTVCILIFIFNYNQLLSEIASLNASTPGTAEYSKYLEFVTSEQKTHGIFLTQIILEVISLIVVSTAPIVQNRLKKIKFKKVDINDEK